MKLPPALRLQAHQKNRYYLRTKAAVEAIKFTVDPEKLKKQTETAMKQAVEEQEQKSKYECTNCGS